MPSLSPEPGLYAEEPPILELPPPRIPSPKASKKGKKAAPKPQKLESEETQPPVVVGGEEAAATRRTSVRLTIPAQPLAAEPGVLADVNEDRYCYCNQVSFGTVSIVACSRTSNAHMGLCHR